MARKSVKKRKADPVVTEIVRNGIIAVTEEMKTNLMRTAYNIIIYEALDFTTGLFTPEGETVSIGIGLPMFIRGMAETVKAKIRHFGTDAMKPGAIYITNDAYLTGSHLNHVTLRLPSRAMGDLRAQVTSVKTGERRFLQLIERYGRAPVLAAIMSIMDHSEASARARTRTIPDGVY